MDIQEFGPNDHIHLIDGSGFIFRAYHALPPLTKSDGTPVGAVSGFCNMLFKMLEDTSSGPEAPTHLAVIFDHKGKTFRSEIFPEYKANRPPPPEDLIPQFDLIREATKAFGVPSIELSGFEADDIIATYAMEAKRLGGKVTIVSSDKDLMQLVDDKITMYDAMKNRRIDEKSVLDKFGVMPKDVIDVQALAGDSVDNVPGAPGIGIKTAAQLITEFGSLDNLLESAEAIKQPKKRETLINNKNNILISRSLVTLRLDVTSPYELKEFLMRSPDPNILIDFLKKMELRTLLKRFSKKVGINELEELKKDNEKESSEFSRYQDYEKKELEIEDFSNFIQAEYEPILDKDGLHNILEQIRNVGFFSLDTETTSLNEREADLVGISVSMEVGKAFYIPVGHKKNLEGMDEGTLFSSSNLDERQLSVDTVIAGFKQVLEDPAILKIGQNIKYDSKILKKYGAEVMGVDDTMLMSFCINGGRHGHGMDALASRYLSYDPMPIKDLIGSGKTAKTFDKVSIEKATIYACEDADITLRLWLTFKPSLVKNKVTAVYETLERPLIPVLQKMEETGILVDRTHLQDMSNKLAKKMAELESDIHRRAGVKFNVGSPKQLGEVLFETLGIPGGKKGKTGAYATGADVLMTLSVDGYDLAQGVLDYRQMSKLKSTYTDALQDHIDSQSGRVHTSYMSSGASTGRLSSSDPNLQNIPIRTEEGRRIREAFVSKDGYQILSLDYSQIELRILAHIAEIDSLKKAFRDDLDIHAMTASEIFNVPLDRMTPDIRRRAKAINFGVIYGISAFGLANNLRIKREEAKNFIDTYFIRYPGIKEYMDSTVQAAKSDGYVSTLFGRKIHTPEINSKGPAGGFAWRAAINAPIQGTAADIIKRAMIKTANFLEGSSLDAKMLLQVHDELIFEVKKEDLEKVSKEISSIMANACNPSVNLSVPLIVDSGEGKSWAIAH